MSTERVPITPEGYKRLQDELQRLKTVERPQVIKMIEYARSLGDISENAEYETAKQRQSFVEGRIQELENRIARAEVIDPSTLPNKDRVMFGVHVTIEEIETGNTITYQLVGPDERQPFGDGGKGLLVAGLHAHAAADGPRRFSLTRQVIILACRTASGTSKLASSTPNSSCGFSRRSAVSQCAS